MIRALVSGGPRSPLAAARSPVYGSACAGVGSASQEREAGTCIPVHLDPVAVGVGVGIGLVWCLQIVFLLKYVCAWQVELLQRAVDEFTTYREEPSECFCFCFTSQWLIS